MSVEKKHAGLSLDEIDNKSFNAGPSPLDSESEALTLEAGVGEHPAAPSVVSLDGLWEMAEDGHIDTRLAGEWTDSIPAAVPGSVHSALVQAGLIPDPSFGKYDALAREKSFKNWFLKRTFSRSEAENAARLVFEGIAISASVHLNGKLLGAHEGMFGGPEFDITDKLEDENTLVVQICPAPYKEQLDGFTPHTNIGWRNTVVFNNVYGWHYSNIPSLGIWNSVRIEAAPVVRVKNPFVATRNAKEGVVDLVATLAGASDGWAGTLVGTVAPENFEGHPYHFSRKVQSTEAKQTLHLSMTIPDPHLWWPVDLGDPSLYELTLSFIPDGEGVADTIATTFGIRTIEMATLPGGPYADKFDWTFIINGKASFIKGNGWCTMDPLMDFSRDRYDRFLTLAASQHIQMMRGWGSGMPETDDFYDLCDRKGIMVMQEWPTAWDSHLEQPYIMLEETVRLNTLRLRNRPSLAMWGGGNESANPFGPAIDMMGRLAVELDGTRAFHRGEPFGGSEHDYACYWGWRHMDHNMTMQADFYGEFGFACLPNIESVKKYLPESEKNLWPPRENGVFAHHTPMFNTKDDMKRLRLFAGYFSKGETMASFITASQLSQAVGLRHPLERARTRWPHCTGALYYKMNDNYPAASWSTADWYGAPKIGHYACQDAFAPLHACVIMDKLDNTGVDVSWPVFLLDDADALADSEWQIEVTAYDSALNSVKSTLFEGQGSQGQVLQVGEFTLTAAQTATTPLLVVAEIRLAGAQAGRTFYFVNFEAEPDCLFNLPNTTLDFSKTGDTLTVTNTGGVPAVGVNFPCPEYSDSILLEDSYFWLNQGETKTVQVNDSKGVSVAAWNAAEIGNS